MHSIERYGIVALLFLVVTVVAVLMWDGKEEAARPAAGVAPVVTRAHPPAAELDADARERRLTLVADSQPGPLTRASRRAPDEPVLESAPVLDDVAGARAPAPERLVEDTPAPSPALATPPTTAEGAPTHAYVVRAGDTLSQIAQRELGSARRWKEIVAANPGLQPEKLRAGRTIALPGKAGAGATETAARGAAERAGPAPREEKPTGKARTWKVSAGESLWRIAERALGDGKRWREIAALNPRVNPDRLVAGQVLLLPASGREREPSGAARTASAPRPAPGAKVIVAQDSTRTTRRGGRVR